MTLPINGESQRLIHGLRGHIASLASDTGHKRQIVEKQLPDPIGNLRSKH
jgi:hypothetical protein